MIDDLAAASKVCAIYVDATKASGRAWLSARSRYARPVGYVVDNRFVAPYHSVYQGFSDGVAPTYKPFPNIVRPEPSLMYVATASRIVPVEFHLKADPDLGGTDGVIYAVQWLSDLNQPTFDEKARRRLSPPVVTLYLGDVLHMRAVVTGFSVRWSDPWTRDAAVGPMPLGADVVLQFQNVPEGFENYTGDARRTDAAGGLR